MKKQFTLRSGLAAAVAGLALTSAFVPVIATSASAASKATSITIWASGGDQIQEQNAINVELAAYNKMYAGKYHATVTYVPNISTIQENANASAEATVMETDGPTVDYLAYGGKLAPVSAYVSSTIKNDQSSYIQAENSYKGKLYGVATINGTLTLYGNKTLLNDAGITACGSAPTTATCYPSAWSKAWTAAQFGDVLKALKASSAVNTADGNNPYVWASNVAYGGEYGAYAFLPILNSAGSNVVNNYKADFNTPSVVKALNAFDSWLPLNDPTSAGEGSAFAAGKEAILWGGHWQLPSFVDSSVTNAGKNPGNLVTMPLPNFGFGAKDGAGSNTWTVGADATTAQKKAAGAWLDLMGSPKYQVFYTYGNGTKYTYDGATVPKFGDGAVPADPAAIATDPTFEPSGYLYQAGVAETNTCPAGVVKTTCFAVPRPGGPAYPVISSAIATMFQSLFSASATTAASTATVKSALATAVDAINTNFQQFNDYK